MDQFLKRCFYHSGQYDSQENFAQLDKKLKEHEVILVTYLSFDFASNSQNLHAYARESWAGNLFFHVILSSCQIGLLHTKDEVQMAYE